jgi:hypothetical protein
MRKRRLFIEEKRRPRSSLAMARWAPALKWPTVTWGVCVCLPSRSRVAGSPPFSTDPLYSWQPTIHPPARLLIRPRSACTPSDPTAEDDLGITNQRLTIRSSRNTEHRCSRARRAFLVCPLRLAGVAVVRRERDPTNERPRARVVA